MSLRTHGSNIASQVGPVTMPSPVTEVSCLRDGSHCRVTEVIIPVTEVIMSVTEATIPVTNVVG